MTETRCDLHLHSSASIGNDEWYTRFFGCPESYADPVRQYELCKERGMSLVTLTDHDTISGGLELVGRPDFFLSEEVTALFPENGCVMHVLAWNITPAQHEQIQACRSDIYRLSQYLTRERIAHGLAHPLLSPNWQLDAETMEKLLLLFPTFEGKNGLTDARIEPDLTMLLERLTPEVIQALAAKHGITPNGATPHRKALTAGSDDHVHRRCGAVYTAVDGAITAPAVFLERCLTGQGRGVGKQADLNAMALCVQHTTYNHLKQRQSERSDYRDPFVEMVDVIAGREPRPPAAANGHSGSNGVAHGGATGFLASLLTGAQRASLPVGRELDILDIDEPPSEERDARIINSIARLSDTVIETALQDLLAGAQDFDLYRIFGAFRDIAGGLVTAAPIFFAADHFGRQELQVRRLWEQWRAFPPQTRPERLAVFTDSLEQVDGVSVWCKRFVDRARVDGRQVLIPYCGELPAHFQDRASFHPLPAASSFTLPLYTRIQFHLPSLIETLSWVWRERITHLELSTPGPMGLAGLLVAKILKLPVTASYHTEVPALIGPLGGNAWLEKAARKYTSWFYGQVDRVFAFSSGSRDALIDMGVDAGKLSVMPVAIDPEDFSPAHCGPAVFEHLNLDVGDRPVVLSVGRISEEKNIPVIVEAVERLQSRAPRPLLVVAGDGPERVTLEQAYRSKEFVRFVGLQKGDTLKRLYASARMFVFASRVDTLGMVNMEAMSSGVPVLVPADACIAEFVTDGLSAECYEFGATGLAAAIARILDDPRRAELLSTNGRRAMIERWKEVPFSRIWNSFTQNA
ncbi:MAG TPA: glycosyltransferase [Polyangia bacterium]|jgi:glycosyltransferase involved in cell wall biosynthesis|nr:glycosyltransferase [Polyangia bacterium]